MTVIAWDGRILAADGMVTTGGDEPMIVQKDYQKIHVRGPIPRKRGSTSPHWLACAGSGAEALSRKFRDWLFSETKDPWSVDREDRDQFHAVALRLTECSATSMTIEATEYDGDGYGYPITGLFAVGLGRREATAAMMSGADALEAVRVTCDLNPFCGGGMFFLDTHNWQAGVQRK